ncbi:MAG: TM2 domain-containing protein [Gammaproteobacteria bacterium]|nr:TM2 domain-containing protein [Gammaproteobacteria bacterium]
MNEPTYFMLLKNIRDSIPETQRANFDLQLALRQKSTTIALVFSLLTGVLGVDRFYLGQIGLGILKLITVGGCGFWTFIDWFLIMGAARSKNIEIANEIRYQLA